MGMGSAKYTFLLRRMRDLEGNSDMGSLCCSQPPTRFWTIYTSVSRTNGPCLV